MSTSEVIYEPLLPPFHSLTPKDRGPLALVTANTLLVITTLTVAVKLWMRYATTRSLGLSDAAVIAAISCAIGQTIGLGIAVNHGLGRHADQVTNSDIAVLSKAYYASNILLVLALTAAKASITLMVIAIKPRAWVMYACYGTLAFIGAWGVASTLALALQCSPDRWALGPSSGPKPQTCVDQYVAQIAIRAIDIASDLVIVALPVFMMQTVQVTRQKRWTVIMLFGLRIATPILTAASIVSSDDFYHSKPDDRPWNAVTLALWTSAALNVSIITACIPSIKRFLADWAAGLSKTQISEPFELGHTGGKTSGPSAYAQGSGLGSKIATKLGLVSESRNEINSTLRSRGEGDNVGGFQHASFNTRSGGRRAQTFPEKDTSDSVKGLTDDVIMHTTEYRVEFEDGINVDNRPGSCSSSGREAGEVR